MVIDQRLYHVLISYQPQDGRKSEPPWWSATLISNDRTVGWGESVTSEADAVIEAFRDMHDTERTKRLGELNANKKRQSAG